jgi:hypothetical protein
MESPNIEIYHAGHEAFNRRDFVAMTKQLALLTQLGLMPQPS